MDPKLRELLRGGWRSGDEEVELILRLDRPLAGLPGVRIISRFGPIVTCRLRREAIPQTYAEEAVLSMKPPGRLGPERERGGAALYLPPVSLASDIRRPPGLPLTGRCVVVGVVDWGCDIDCPSFKHPDGTTRLLALWDQRGHPRRPNRYGYGTIYWKREIDRALAAADPCAALGYHHADPNAGDIPTHGTHVMDIAAGNGLGGGPVGVAPRADLVFVHLATRATGGLLNLSDSARILEAVHFVGRVAAGRPWVVNLSVGSHGGPHDGRTLTEMAFDYALGAAPDRFIVQSTGNYFDGCVHASGRLREGEDHALGFTTDAADATPNELEVWYSGRDAFAVRTESPWGTASAWVRPGEQAEVVEGGRTVGRLYNRVCDPNNHKNHIDLFIYPNAPPGRWAVILRGERIEDGRFDAWLERDEACPRCQVRFDAADADSSCTTGTLANGRLPLAVGAYDAHAPDRPIAPFSSVGPTLGGLSKPDLVAPGVGVLAARSTPMAAHGNPGLLTRKSGTSMAAPHVAGAVALCFEGAGRPLYSHQIRALMLSHTDAPPAHNPDAPRYGRGYLNVERVVEAALAPPRDDTGRDAHERTARRSWAGVNGFADGFAEETPHARAGRGRPAPPSRPHVHARILWPALGFPAVIAPRTPPSESPFRQGDATRCICVLLLSDKKDLSKRDAARHLRYVPWSQRHRRHIRAGDAGSFQEVDLDVHAAADHHGFMLEGAPKDRLGTLIQFGANEAGERGIVATLAHKVRRFYADAKLRYLYEIRVYEHASRLPEGAYHLFWNNERDDNGDVPSDEMRLLVERHARPLRQDLLKGFELPDGESWERQERYLLKEYEREYGAMHPPHSKHSSKPTTLKMREPRAEILHPLFVRRPGPAPLRLGHLTDMHVSVRADVYEANLKPHGAEDAYNNWNRSFKTLYDHAARTSDALFLTGDLIDYGRGHWGLSAADRLGDDSAYHIDRNWFLFYDLIAAGDAYRQPVYTILGNHDWRLNPYPPYAPGAPNPSTLFQDVALMTPQKIEKHLGRTVHVAYQAGGTRHTVRGKLRKADGTVFTLRVAKERDVRIPYPQVLGATLTLTAEERKELLNKAHGPGFDRMFTYFGETESELTRELWKSGDLVGMLKDIFMNKKTLDRKHLPTETVVESVAWYLLSINPFLDYAFSFPSGQSALMLDWAEDEDLLFPIARGGKTFPYMVWHLKREALEPGQKAGRALSDLQRRLVEEFAGASGRAKIIGIHAPPIGPYPDWTDDDLLRGIKTYPGKRDLRSPANYGRKRPDGTVAPWNGHPIFAVRPDEESHGTEADYGSLGRHRERAWLIARLRAAQGVRLVLAGHIHRNGLYVVHQPGGDPKRSPVAGKLLVRGIPASRSALLGTGVRPPLYVNTTSAGPRGNRHAHPDHSETVDPGYARIELAPDGTIRHVFFEELGEVQTRRPAPTPRPAPAPVSTGAPSR